MPDLKPESYLVSAARPEGAGAALNVPLVPCSTFLNGGERNYSREDSTPTWAALEELVGGLEGGEAVAFSSGMAAADAVLDQVPGGGRIALPRDVYPGVTGLAVQGEAKGRWTLDRFDTEDTQAWIDAAGTHDLLWIETPSNPLLMLADLRAICAAERREGCLIAVDNTFATPLNQRPLEVGADISMHSATKYIGGHSDLLAGMLVAARPDIVAGFKKTRMYHGATPGALEAWLAVRGLRTMAIRFAKAQANAQRVAEFLEAHPKVERAIFPGLVSHPCHAIAREQLDGYGAVVSFVLKGDGEKAEAVCRAARLIHHCTSLGGVESTMERRAAQSGQEAIPPSLIRLSVGIESADDLVADLEQALAGA